MNIGKLNYLNNDPIYFGLEKKDISIIEGTPSYLNKRFCDDSLDITPISVAQFLLSIEDTNIIKNLSISSNNEVQSILLISKVPVNELNYKKIAITNSSATSIMLLKILMKYLWKIESSLIAFEPDIEQMLKENDAALLIGDDALQYIWKTQKTINQYDVIDLGRVWSNWTSLPMVYAVWAYRKSHFSERSTEITYIQNRLLASRDYGLSNILDVIDEASKRTGYAKNKLLEYYKCISYDLSPKKIEGLLLFAKLANNMNLINVDIDLIKTQFKIKG